MKDKRGLIPGCILVLLWAGLVVLSIITGRRTDTVTLTYADVNPIEGTIVGEMALAFKEKTEELSGGTVIIDIQANGVLGSDDQILDNMMGGGNITDITRVSAFALVQYGCEKAALLGIPYTFVSEDHFWKFADSELAEEFLLEPHNVGLPMRGLCYGEEGFRNFFFKDEINDISDIKGRKIRVSADPIMTGMVTDIGGSATTVAFTELYSALSTGVVDGAEQPTPNYLSNAFNDVAPNLLLDGHTLGVVQMLISDYSWERLTEQQREWVTEAAKYASHVCRQKEAEITRNTYDMVRKKGVTIVEVADKSPWIEACQPTVRKNIKGLEDVYQQILDMQNE